MYRGEVQITFDQNFIMINSLTPREREIVKLILEELTTSDIAGQLNISVRTVETHRKNIYRKVGSRNVVGLVKKAINDGLMQRLLETT